MIYDILPINSYIGNNTSTTFDFDFYVENSSQLDVFLYNSDGSKIKLTYNIDYSVNEFGNLNGGYITFPLVGSSYSILSDDEKISLELTLPISQETVYNNGSLLNFKSIEYSFDYVTRLIQILSRRIGNCIEISGYTLENFGELVQRAIDCSHAAQIAYENIRQHIYNPASANSAGVVKIGSGINVNSSGLISVTDFSDKSLQNLTTLGNSRLQYTPFALNYGTISQGGNTTLTYSGSILSCAPCIITTCDGRSFVDNNTVSYDVTNLDDGNYFVFKKHSTGTLFLTSGFGVSKDLPLGSYSDISSEGTAISGGDGPHGAANAFDGNTSTFWGCSQVGSSNILGRSYIGKSGLSKPVKKIGILQASSSFYCKGLKFQYSNDGTNWIDIDTITDATYSTLQEWVLPSYTPTGATHSFRVLAYSGFGGASNNNWEIWEIYLYAFGEAADYWLDISSVPANFKVYDNDSWTVDNDYVYIGECSVSTGEITSVLNVQFNMNSYFDTFNLPDYSNKISISNGVSYKAESNGWIITDSAIIKVLYKDETYTPTSTGYYFCKMKGF